MIIGSGRKLAFLQKYAKKQKENQYEETRDIEEQWQYWSSKLTSEFVELARETKFVRYSCPGRPWLWPAYIVYHLI